MAFLEDIEKFRGTGEKNEEGKSLEEFLDAYNPKMYDNPCVTTDILVIRHPKKITEVERGLKILLIKRKNHPGIGMWALPGGFTEIKESLEESAKRELMEETGLTGIPVEQLYAWGAVDRDPRTRIVTVSFLAMVEDELLDVQAGDDAKDAMWAEIILDKIETASSEDSVCYSLKLNGIDRDELLSATVEVSQKKNSILKEADFHVLERDGIAFDHPSMIVHALLKIKENALAY